MASLSTNASMLAARLDGAFPPSSGRIAVEQSVASDGISLSFVHSNRESLKSVSCVSALPNSNGRQLVKSFVSQIPSQDKPKQAFAPRWSFQSSRRLAIVAAKRVFGGGVAAPAAPSTKDGEEEAKWNVEVEEIPDGKARRSQQKDGIDQAALLASARRRTLLALPGVMLGATVLAPEKAHAEASKYTDMPALRGKDYGKIATRYPDYVLTETGLQYKDLKEGSGPTPQSGQTVVIDWAGFTIGYYGRIFEARNKAKGGSFEGNDKEFYRFRVGQGQVIPAFEEAIEGMKPGGIRRIVVPPDLGYPNNDFNLAGPKPMTFSGQRALDFVLKNQGLIDKTLLFDIELLRIAE